MELVSVISLVLSFVLTVASVKLLIPILTRLKLGQRILEIGPTWHSGKSGTPTMGGIAFIIIFSIVSVVCCLLYECFSSEVTICIIYAVLSGTVGLIDDAVKMRHKRNEGLTPFAKFTFQLVLATAFVISVRLSGVVDTAVYLPFIKKELELGRFFYPFSLLFLTGFANAVNLTDGLDGLCASVSSVNVLFFAIIALGALRIGDAVLAFSVLGICLGFLVYNSYPAKIFMGDTGSLFLGGVISALAFVSGKETVLFIVGGIYILEAVSVVLQVVCYKTTKKRLFLMAPIHHHFEKKGKSETTVTLGFTAVSGILAVVAYCFA